MDRRVQLQRYTTARNPFNEPIKTYATYATVWAQKTDLTEYEAEEQAQQVAVNRTTFRIRHRSDVKATDRVLYDSKEYEVIGIKELGRREGLVLTTELRD